MTDPFASATEIAAYIRRREVSPLEVVDLYAERIQRLNADLNAFCRLDLEAARETARQLGDRIAGARPESLPPFLGVPIGIKDLHGVAGWPVCGASDAVPHPVAEVDGPVVAALRAAGFVLLGATTSPEFGVVSVTESNRHGITRNPWDLGISPGGSSGGSAAAVAAGMLPIAHGSDGAGSIREPASHCGLVGLKPTRARVPARWIGGLATEGVLTRTVADTAAVLDVLATQPRHAWYHVPPPPQPYAETIRHLPERLRIGVCLEPALPTVVDNCAVAVATSTADLLAGLGHEVREVAIPGLDPEWLQPRFETLWAPATAGLHDLDEDRLEPLNRELRRRAQATDSLQYVEAMYDLQVRSAQLLRTWDDIDVLVTPTNPGPAAKTGALWSGQEHNPMLPMRRAEATAAFTVLANLLGLPAISLPLFTQPDGMPLGVQLIGGPWDDATVLALSRQLESIRPWRDRRPPVADPMED